MTFINCILFTFLILTLGLTQAQAAKTKVNSKPRVSQEEKIKTCSEILKAKLPDTLKSEKLNVRLDTVMDNRLEIAFGRTALAYLKLQAERDKGRLGEADHVASNIRTMPAADKELADKLFELIEKDPPEQNTEKIKEYLDGLLQYSKRLNLKSYQIMDYSDVTLMSGFLAGEATTDTPQGYGKIFRELRELALYKGGRANKDLTSALTKKIDSFQNIRRSYISKAQQAILAEIKKMSDLSSECKRVLTNLLAARKADKLTSIDENCETFAFLNSAFPTPTVLGFARMNGQAISYLLNSGVDQVEPYPIFEAIKRGEIKCRNFSENGDLYKFDLLINAPRKTFQGWSFRDPNGELKPLSAPEQKFVKTKKGKAPAKEGNINFDITKFEVPKNKVNEKLKIISENGQEFEIVDLVRACKLPVAAHNQNEPQGDPPNSEQNQTEPKKPETQTVKQLELDNTGCSYSVSNSGKIKIDQIKLNGADPQMVGASVKIGTKSEKLKDKDGTIGIFDLTFGDPPLPETITITKADGTTVDLSLKDCGNYGSIQDQIDLKKAEKEEKEKTKTKEAKEAEIKTACEGGEGKWITRNDFSFIACRNGISDGERKMIRQFCDGQNGEYDIQTDKVYCAPYNSSAPAPLSFPTLPASPFGVGGVTVKGFY